MNTEEHEVMSHEEKSVRFSPAEMIQLRDLVTAPLADVVREENERTRAEIRRISDRTDKIEERVADLETLKGRLLVGWTVVVMIASLMAKAVWEWVERNVLRSK